MIEIRLPRLCGFFLSCFLFAVASPSQAQSGALVTGDRVLADFDRHWQQWTRPTHLTLVEGGSLRSRSLRAVYDVLSDKRGVRVAGITRNDPRTLNIDSTLKVDVLGNPVTDFAGKELYEYIVRPGISRVGSNPELAQNILDGIDTTYWEPDFDDPPEDWWIEVDLGRPLPLERLQLEFVDEEHGDPFYRFILLLAPDQRLFLHQDGNLVYESFIPFEGVNTDQRVFAFDSESQSEVLPPEALRVQPEAKTFSVEDPFKSTHNGNPTVGPAWTGRIVEVIRIVVTNSRRGRAELVSAEQWQALPFDEKGDVVYYLKDDDFEEPVDADAYFRLDEDRRGRLEYYWRERPRLAEVKAWGWGDEVGKQLVSGGGSVEVTGTAGAAPMFDGDYITYSLIPTITTAEPGLNIMTVDLGGLLWMREARLVSEKAPRGYILRGSSGALDAQGALQWDVISSPEHEINFDTGYHRYLVDRFDPLRRLRFLELVFLAHAENFTERSPNLWPRLRELMLFPVGPPAEVVVQSPPIDLNGLYALGAVRWEAQTPPGSNVEIRTRTGDQLVQRITYFHKLGFEVSAQEHKKLPISFKGPVDTTLVAGQGWSPWSQKYLKPGEAATSPGLRRYLQIQARLINRDHEAVPVLERISIDLQQPLAHGLAASVWPVQTRPGRLDTFELFVQPDFLEQPADLRSPGIDEIRVLSEPRIDLRLLDLAVGTEEELAAGQPAQVFDRPHAEGLEDAAGEEVLRVLSQGDSLWLRLPNLLDSAPTGLAPRTYYRQLQPVDEVPTDFSGRLLTLYRYNALLDEERGRTLYLRQVRVGEEEVRLDSLSSKAEFDALPAEEQGPVRYFRKVTGLGGQSAYDAAGTRLDLLGYNRLPFLERGWVVGPGQLVRLRFVSQIYLPSVLLHVAVRQSEVEVAWQEAQAQRVTALRPTETLAIRSSQPARAIDNVTVVPNPFTPNGDGVNERAQIRFSLYKVLDQRPVVLRIYTLAGRLMWQLEEEFLAGRQSLEWDGRDMHGRLVPPGLYLCQLEVEADADVSGLKQTRVIAMAY